MSLLTRKQMEVFEEIKSYIKEYQVSPTIREIQKKLGYKTPSTVYKFLSELEERGYIKRFKNTERGIVLSDFKDTRVSLKMKKKKKELTEKQRNILDFLVSYHAQRGVTPTRKEIARFFRLSESGVETHLSALQKKEYIYRHQGMWNGIEILKIK